MMYLHCFTVTLILSLPVQAYKPVVIIHGILSGNVTMLDLSSAIKQTHPGTEVYVTGRFGSWSSLLPMWHQIVKIGSDVVNISSRHPEGIHIIGYSQGGLIARGIIEAYPDLNVKTFISLSSPQGGQYGTKFLHLVFPNLSCETAYELFYSRVGQQISVANYWRDPHETLLYMEYSRFLPYINNEIQSEFSTKYKTNIEKLEKLVLIGGPDDGVITPWQSSRFAFLDDAENVIELQDQPLFQMNSLGLRKLNETGRLKIVELAGVSHYSWHSNKTVIFDYLIPELD